MALPIHAHFGINAVIQDYLPHRRTPSLFYLATGALYAVTILTIYGLYSFNTNDIGLTQLISNVWHADKKSTEAKKAAEKK